MVLKTSLSAKDQSILCIAFSKNEVGLYAIKKVVKQQIVTGPVKIGHVGT